MESEGKRASVRLPNDTMKRFKAALALDDITAQEFFERAVNEYLDKEKPV